MHVVEREAAAKELSDFSALFRIEALDFALGRIIGLERAHRLILATSDPSATMAMPISAGAAWMMVFMQFAPIYRDES